MEATLTPKPKPSSAEEIGKTQMALKSRRRTAFETHWAAVIGDDGLIEAGLRYRRWKERGQPVISAYGEVKVQGDQERRFAEYDLQKRAEMAVYEEYGTLGHFMLHGALLHDMTALQMVDARLCYLTRQEMKALGAELTRQRLTEIKRKYVTGLVEKTLQVVYDVFNRND